MKLRARQAKFWLKIAQVLIKAAELKTPIVVLDWDRTVEEQRLLVARGASQTMDSKHLEGLAVDFCFLQDLEEDGEINWEFDRYAPLGEFAEHLGLIWGGRWKRAWDRGHLEMP